MCSTRRSSFLIATSADPAFHVYCIGIAHRYTFSASACSGNGICNLSPVSGNAAVQVGGAYYGPSGEAVCDGQVSCN